MWTGSAFAGTALAWIGATESSGLWAILFSVGCALASARAESRGGETHEAITGWVFLAAGSISILMLAHSPHGVEEIQRLVASSLIGAERRDVVVFGVLGALAIAAAAFLRPQVMLYAMDPSMASSVGLPVRLMSLTFAVALGVAVGLSIRVAGMLYTFGCLVLPAMAAKSLCREVGQMFWVAPLVGLLSAVGAFVVANHRDFPPAQMTVAMLSVVVVAAWAVRWTRNRLRRRAA
jgi:ABC-type Mn2+/Zn2+ transport system permease subunit